MVKSPVPEAPSHTGAAGAAGRSGAQRGAAGAAGAAERSRAQQGAAVYSKAQPLLGSVGQQACGAQPICQRLCKLVGTQRQVFKQPLGDRRAGEQALGLLRLDPRCSRQCGRAASFSMCVRKGAAGEQAAPARSTATVCNKQAGLNSPSCMPPCPRPHPARPSNQPLRSPTHSQSTLARRCSRPMPQPGRASAGQ